MSRRLPAMLLLIALLLLAVTGCQDKGPQWLEIEPGLTYADSVVGTGELVGPTDFVEVHYTGWLFDPELKGEDEDNAYLGEKFDSSYDHPDSAAIAFPLGRNMVIPGWEKGLVGMKVGGRRRLKIEPTLAYGEQGRPPVIPANSTLVFDAKIVSLPKVDIEVIEAGTGPVAQRGDNISVHYTGWIWENGAKGAQFDSSAKTGRPYRFTIGARMVIPGWDLAFEGMPVGEKARLIIPPVLGYGKQGAAGSIPPNSTLCFEVELVSIEEK